MADLRGLVGKHGLRSTSGVLVHAVTWLATAGGATAQTPDTPQSMTVTDVIQMTTFGSQPWAHSPDADVLSPDGQLHAVVLKRGDLQQNRNVFSLLIFRAGALFTMPVPDTVLTLSSTSNRPAIAHVKWLSDNRTLALLGERPGELPQVYTFDTRTRQLTPRTHVATEITDYDIAASGDPIAYWAKRPPDTSAYANARQRGFAVRPTQFVGDVLQGAWSESASEWFSTAPPQLFWWHIAARTPIKAIVPESTYRSCDSEFLSVAPGGQTVLLKCTPWRIPGAWHEYTQPQLAKWIASGYTPPELVSLDVNSGTVRPLLDTPALWPTFRWAPTGESIVVANAFLPLSGVDIEERRARAARRGIIEVQIRTGRSAVVTHRDSLAIVLWDSSTNTVDLVPGEYDPGPLRPGGQRVRYRRTANGWVEVQDGPKRNETALVVDQGLNQPQRLAAVDPSTKRRAVILDPNPQLASLRIGREEIVRWRTRSGQMWTGGLYYPPDFAPGKRYPIVIQTHGFDSTAFQPDGYHPTASAAQPMAGLGMLVLQIGIDDAGASIHDVLTPQEAPSGMEEFEGAIDHLDSLGLIDRSRVGLIGFSRTCFHVLYVLTHSRYPIAAAALTDGVDMSYLQYMLFRNAAVGAGNTMAEDSVINGGPPFGKLLDVWRERAPGFNLDRVTAPLRLEAIGLPAVLEEWEPYAGLLLQHKPVELFVIPEGTHLLVKPWERLASSQSNVDWFRFWLKGEVDRDPAKINQYARWRELRRLQRQATLDSISAPK